MASTGKPAFDEGKRGANSPRPKARENTKDTLCRNITIYGHCRYEDKGCAFNHDPQRISGNAPQAESSKKRFNVESPSFTPSGTPLNESSAQKKATTISPKAANAAPFLPKGVTSRTVPCYSSYITYGGVRAHKSRVESNAGTPPVRQESGTPDWTVADVAEFVPQGFDTTHVESVQGSNNGVVPAPNAFDPFVPSSGISTPSGVNAQVQQNPYLSEATAAGGAAFFGAQNAFQQPLQYHLYAPIGPHNQNILGYQRNVHDLFLANDFREELQKKAAATLQILPNSQLPTQVDHFHSLVPLDLSHQKNASIFGYPSWVYKAQSSKDGNFYVLRRLEGFRLTNEKAVRSVQNWKRVCCGSVVTVHDAFTNRSFQDSSLIFVTDYHPMSKTLSEHHLEPNRYQGRGGGGGGVAHTPEQILWSYVTQIASALKAIHSVGLAARVIEPSKVLLTGRNRIRLNACAVLDVVQFDAQRNVTDLQHQDLVNFGQLILTLGANAPSVAHNPSKAMEHFNRAYSPQLNNSVYWLLSGMQKDQERNIDIFVSGISAQLISTFDSALHLDDQLNSDLSREIENARLVRLLTKLNFINERPEHEHDRQWSENGERYFLKLFRDYVFHQVDSQNAPVVDLGHVLGCLNKLDAGTEEKVTLVSRDEQSCFVVSYKELKKAVESSFQALLKPATRM